MSDFELGNGIIGSVIVTSTWELGLRNRLGIQSIRNREYARIRGNNKTKWNTLL